MNDSRLRGGVAVSPLSLRAKAMAPMDSVWPSASPTHAHSASALEEPSAGEADDFMVHTLAVRSLPPLTRMGAEGIESKHSTIPECPEEGLSSEGRSRTSRVSLL